MKIARKILCIFLIVLTVGMLGTYLFFDLKFTPEKNYLTIENESGNIPFSWQGKDKNALLLPIHFAADTGTYYLQFDTGSPYTQFYKNAIQHISHISLKGDRASSTFYLGKSKIASARFKVLSVNDAEKNNDNWRIIGTIGSDVFENRKTLIHFKKNYIVFNLSQTPATFRHTLMDFQFKKRRIIIIGQLNGKAEKFLFDSGTSAYELLTQKDKWDQLKMHNSKIQVEKSEQSWDKVLTTYTAECQQNIQFYNQKIPLHLVTYVEGFSQAQYAMMKYSGMTGMLGNKFFLHNCIYFDCTINQFGIE